MIVNSETLNEIVNNLGLKTKLFKSLIKFGIFLKSNKMPGHSKHVRIEYKTIKFSYGTKFFIYFFFGGGERIETVKTRVKKFEDKLVIF